MEHTYFFDMDILLAFCCPVQSSPFLFFPFLSLPCLALPSFVFFFNQKYSRLAARSLSFNKKLNTLPTLLHLIYDTPCYFL
jgi:hypothetical protein